MRFGCVVSLASLFVVAGAAAPAAEAQQTFIGDIAVSAVAIEYDLSGVGRSAGVAVRATRDLTSNVVLEARGLYARPDQQFGPSTLFVPEAQLQYRWQAARFTPFAGGGLGTAFVRSEFGSEWDPTLVVSGGTGIRLTDRLGLLAEMRVRGIEWRFTGSTAEWGVGLAWRYPSF